MGTSGLARQIGLFDATMIVMGGIGGDTQNLLGGLHRLSVGLNENAG